MYDGQLYSTAARWDGAVWQEAFVTDGTIAQLAVHDGLLFAAGSFTTVNGQAAANIFAWNGVDILELGGGVPVTVRDMIVHGGGVVAAGNAAVMNGGYIARWDGAGWTTLLNGDRVVFSLGEFNGNLVAGTEHQEYAGINYALYPDIMVLDGGLWTSIGPVTGWSLAAAGGVLFIGHSDEVVDGMATPGLVLYDNGTFVSPFPEGWGFGDDHVKFTVHEGHLVAAGSFRYAAGQLATHCMMKVGDAWEPLDQFNHWDPLEPGGFRDIESATSGLYGLYLYINDDYYVPALLKLDESIPENPIWNVLGSGYGSDGSLQAAGSNIYYWTESAGPALISPADGSWDPVDGFNVNGYVRASCAVGNELVLGGNWTTLNGVAASNILAWDGTTWREFAPGLPDAVQAMCAVGPAGLAAAYLANGGRMVARYDGSAWEYHDGVFNDEVAALAYRNNRLVAAGPFSQVGEVQIDGIAVWTGTGWAPVGSGLSAFPPYGEHIEDMLATDDGLHISGSMRLSGGNATEGLAVWTGDLNTIPDGLSPVESIPAEPVMVVLSCTPNPFNPRTEISWEIPHRGFCRLTIHDARGRMVKEPEGGRIRPGAGACGVGRKGRPGSGNAFGGVLCTPGLEPGKLFPETDPAAVKTIPAGTGQGGSYSGRAHARNQLIHTTQEHILVLRRDISPASD